MILRIDVQAVNVMKYHCKQIESRNWSTVPSWMTTTDSRTEVRGSCGWNAWHKFRKTRHSNAGQPPLQTGELTR